MANKSQPSAAANVEPVLNREEDIVLREQILQGLQLGTICKNRDFYGELQHADLQHELLGNLPELSARAIANLNRLLTAFPTYSGPNRLVRAAQSSVAAVHAQATAFADSIAAQKHQAKVANAVFNEVAAKHEAFKQKERERRARSQRARDNGQTTITSHIMRGGVAKAPPTSSKASSKSASSSRAGSAPAQSRGFRSSTPNVKAAEAEPKKEVITVSDSSDSEKKTAPRRSPRLGGAAAQTEDKMEVTSNSSPSSSDVPLEQTDGNVATMSSGSSTGSSPKKSAFSFFRNIVDNTAEEAVILAEKHADQERGVEFADSWGPISHIPHHDNLGEHRAAMSDLAEDRPASEDMEEETSSPLDLTIKRIM